MEFKTKGHLLMSLRLKLLRLSQLSNKSSRFHRVLKMCRHFMARQGSMASRRCKKLLGASVISAWASVQ